MGEVLAINISTNKGTQKDKVDEALLQENFGIVGDAHAGKGHRQVSLLATESIDKIRNQMPGGICFGRFAENITTKGIKISDIKTNTLLKLGDEVILKITQIGKECHNDCEIKRIAGECVMPKQGVFAEVIKGGKLKCGDLIYIVE